LSICMQASDGCPIATTSPAVLSTSC
jgi:hypothetical protein